MFKFTKTFQQKEQKQKQKQKQQEQEKKRIEEIKKIDQKVSDIKKEYSIQFSINKLSEKREKTPEEINNLNEMLDIYIEKQNEFKPSVSLASTELNQAKKQEIQVPTPSGVEVIDQLQKVQVKPLPTPSGVNMIDQLKEKLAKRRVLIDKDINTEQTQNSQDNSSFKLQQDIKKQENQVNPLPTSSDVKVMDQLQEIQVPMPSGVKMIDQLKEKLAKRRVLIDKDINTEQTQNAQDHFSLLQNLQIAIKNLKKMEVTEQTNNLPIWVEIDFLLERLAYSTNEKEDEDLEFRLDEKISHQFRDQSDEEFIKQAASIKNSYFYDKIVPILKTLKRYLTSEKFEELNNEISAKNSKKQLDKKTFQELDLQAEFFKDRLSIIVENNFNIGVVRSSDQSHSDASCTINGNKGSKNISAEFDKIEMQCQETMQQLEAIDPKQHEDQTSKDLKDKKVKFSEIPTTVYFKTLPPIDNKDPVVVSAALKS